MAVSARKVRINIVKFSGFNKESHILLDFIRKKIFSQFTVNNNTVYVYGETAINELPYSKC